jgi:TP901 family phage tail tape measure protein
MAEGAGGSVFVDVITRLQQATVSDLGSQMAAKMKSVGDDAGSAFSDSFGKNVSASAASMASTVGQSASQAATAMRSSMDDMVAAMERNVSAAGDVEVAQRKYNDALSAFESTSTQAIEAENNLLTARRTASSAARDAEAAITSQTAATAAAADAATKSTNATKESALSAAAFGKAATVAGTAITAGFVGAVGVAVDQAANFQSSQTRLVTSAGEAAKSLQQVSDGILQMSSQVGESAQTLSTGMYTVESAGFHGADALTVLKAAAEGSKNENADLTDVTDALTTSLGDFGLSSSQAGQVMSAMQTAVSHGKTTLEEFAGALHSVEPAAHSAGISMDDVYATLSAVTISGESADEATQNMNSAIRSLADPTQTMTEEMSQFGINSATVSQQLGQRGLSGSLQLIADTIKSKMNPAQQVVINTMEQNTQVLADAQKMYAGLPAAAQKVADAVKNGTESFADFRKTGAGLAVDQKNMVDQWLALQNKSQGFNTVLKSGTSDIQTYEDALTKATGTTAGATVAMQVSGDNAKVVNSALADLKTTTTEADGSVKGWSETQGTFNQKMSEFKSSVGTTGIELGNTFLPAATAVAKVLADVGQWLTKNKGYLDALFLSVGVAAGAFAVFKTAMAVWKTLDVGITGASAAMGLFTVSEEGATEGAGVLGTALASTGITEIILGITALVAVIAAMVAGVVYAYDHWKLFHTAVQDVWDGLKAAGDWIAKTFTSTLHDLEHAWDNVTHAWDNVTHAGQDVATAVEHAFGNVEHAGSNVEHAVSNVEHAIGNVGHAADNVGHAISNVVDFIDKSLRVVAAIVTTVLVVPFVLAFDLIKMVVMAWWHDVVEPAASAVTAIFHGIVAVVEAVAHGIGVAWNMMWNTVIRPNIEAMKVGIGAVGVVLRTLYDDVVQPVTHGISTAVHWLYDTAIKTVTDLISLALQGVGDMVNWLHDKVVEPVLHGIADLWNWLYNEAIHPAIDGINVAIQGCGVIVNWLHDSVIKPVGDKIKTVMDGMKIAFKDVVDWLDTQWNRITGIVGPPIKFIADTVYNQAIVPVWNDVAGVFGLGKLDKVDVSNLTGSGNSAPVPHAGGGVWQGGGVLPGYAPGQDTQNALLSPGEGVAVPEFVNAIGARNFIALNAAFSGGRAPGSGPGFATGTVFGDIGSAVGGAISDVASVGKSVVGAAVDTAKFMAKLLTDPAGAVKDLFGDAISKSGSTPGDPSSWLDMAKDIPAKFVDSLVQKAIAWVSGATSGGKGAPGIPFTGTPDLMGWISQAEGIAGVTDGWTSGLVTLIGRESGGSPNATNTTDINAQQGDPSRGLMQTIGTTFESNRDPSLPDNIFDPVANIVAGIKYIEGRYGVTKDGANLSANVQQADSMRAPMGYATGGVVPSTKTKAAPDPTAINRAIAWVQSLDGQPYNAQGWLDCSGLVSGVYDELLAKPLQRMFTTVSDFTAMGFVRGSGGVMDIGVTPKPGQAGHMAATLGGHKIESGGPHDNIAIDGPAIGADDSQFSDHYYLPGKLFNPVYTGQGATPGAAAVADTKLSADAQKFATAATAATKAAQTATTSATTHDQEVQKYLASAAKEDALAAISTGTAKTSHTDSANHYRQLIAAAQAAAQKARDTATTKTQEAQDDKAKASQAQQDAQAQASSAVATATSGTSGTSTTGSTGMAQPMSLHDFGSQLGGIAADAFTESLGLQNTVIADPSQSPIFKIGAAIAGAKWFQPPAPAATVPATTGTVGTTADTTTNPTDVAVMDSGGWLDPGALAINLSRNPEPVLGPSDQARLDAVAKSGANGNGLQSMVHIDTMHVTNGDGRQAGRDIARQMLAYQSAGVR